VAEDDGAVFDESDGHRRPHARGGRVLAGTLVDAAICLLDKVGHAPLAAARDAFVVPDRAGREAGGELAGLRAAHAVGDREERRLDDVLVLVPAPPLAGIRAVPDVCDQVSNLSSVSPTRTTSPGVNLRARVSLIPFRKVPLVEPMSSTQTPSRRDSIRACFAEA